MELRPVRGHEDLTLDADPRPHVLGARRRAPHLLRRAQHWLYALDATTGKPIASFGDNGRVDLRLGFEGREPGAVSIRVNTPGVFYGDLLILGSVVPEGLPSAPGDIRAFDVHTGRQKWAFHTIPHPGELGYDTWPKDAWKYTGGANAWSGLSLDAKRGLVYAATGSAAYDFYGANRLGDNLFANTILCLKAATGERVWHFQAVKHDVWDRDFPAAPALITITKDGKRRDVVAQIAKNGRTYVLDRETGEPVYPMEELARRRRRTCRASGSRRRSVLPTLPPPFTRHEVHRGSGHHAHAGRRARRCGRNGRTLRNGRRVRSAEPRRARSCSRAWTAAANGAASPSTRARACSTSTRTRWRGASS